MSKSVVLRLLPPTRADVAEGNWLIGPCGQTRDSDMVDQANFIAATEDMVALDPNYLDHEVLGWNHWACGWIEEIAARPGSECAKLQADLRERLAEYPVLSEDVLSTLEMEQAMHNEDDSDPPEVTAAEVDIPFYGDVITLPEIVGKS